MLRKFIKNKRRTMNIKITREQARKIVKDYLYSGPTDLYDPKLLQELKDYADKMEKRSYYTRLFYRRGVTKESVIFAFNYASHKLYVELDERCHHERIKESLMIIYSCGYIGPFEKSNKLLNQLELKLTQLEIKYELICRRIEEATKRARI